MLVFPAIGLLLWIAFLLGVLVLCSIVWVLSNLILWLMDLKPRLTGPKPAVSSTRNVPRVPVRNVPRVSTRAEPQVPAVAEPQVGSDIWPKWNASHRGYMDRELSLWQKQFDALNSRK